MADIKNPNPVPHGQMFRRNVFIVKWHFETRERGNLGSLQMDAVQLRSTEMLRQD
jgi:hypothetical protein